MSELDSFSNVFSGSFYKAPICRLAFYGSMGGFLFLKFPAVKLLPYFNVNVDNVIQKHEIWRLPLSKLCFTDTRYLLLGLILILQFKKFEKRYGTRKFASYLFSTFLLTQVMEFGLLYLSYKNILELDSIPNGPLSVLFSLFVPFHLDIPRIVRAAILGIPITGKAIAYICGLQIASSSLESLLLTVTGLIAGGLYRKNFLCMKSHGVIPQWLSSVCDRLLSPIFGVSAPTLPRTYGATLELQRLEEEDRLEQAVLMRSLQQQRGAGQNREVRGGLRNWLGRAGGNMEVEPPSDEMVQMLTSMGFSRDRVLEALRLSSNDLTQATNYLLASN